MAKVGIIQSSYIPWRGYFDFIRSVDLFIILDDVQFSKGSWRNRNKIKTPNAAKWLTVPVRHLHLDQLIENTDIDYSKPWQQSHRDQLRLNYNTAPFVNEALKIFDAGIVGNENTISQLNIRLTKEINNFLNISTPIIESSELAAIGSKTERLINLLEKVHAKTYLSGPSADGYLDKDLFKKHGIRLEYKSYDYEPYPQLWGEFDGAVSVLDLIANCGPESQRYLISQKPDVFVV